MNEVTKQKIIAAVKDEKMSLKELAAKLFITEAQLKLLLKQWGVEIVKSRKYEKREAPPREELMAAYAEARNTKNLADRYKVGINTVNRWMKSYNIPTRKLAHKSNEQKVAYLEDHLAKLNNIEL